MKELAPLINNLDYAKLHVRLFKNKRFDFITLNDGVKHLKQEEALRILTDATTTELGYGGAAGGAKSWTGCEWLFWSCLAYPDTKWFIGRQELKRITESTLITFYKVVKKYDLAADSLFKYNGQYHFIQFHNGSRIDLLDLRLLPSDPMFERYGSLEYTGGWIEEGGEVPFGAYDTLKSRIGRHNNDKYGLKRKLLVTLNPKKNWAYNTFYKPAKLGELPDYRQFLQALVYDNPFRESDYVEALQSLTDKAKKERLLKGNWEYDDDPAALIAYDNILNLFTNSFVASGQKYITADVARFGKDSCKIALWNGWRVEGWYTLKHEKITAVAAFIRDLATKHRVPMQSVLVDEDGVGGGVVDILGCKGFVNNSRPKPHHNPATQKRVDENYANLRSQCYFLLARVINDNQMYFGADIGETDKEAIMEELEYVKDRDIDTSGKKEVWRKDEIKEMIGRSPDNADTLMMRVDFDLTPPRRRFDGADNS